MEYKIPYKKDLKFKSAEEIDKERQRQVEENLQRDIDHFQRQISNEINYIAKNTSQRYIILDIQEIKEYTRNKNKQDKILKQLQSELNDKGYINYVTKIKFDGKVLVVLLEDDAKGEVEEYINIKNNNNLELIIVTSFALLLGIGLIVGILLFGT